MDLYKIENRILSLSPFIKEIAVVIHNNFPYAYIYPDFEKLKKANIVNIESEIRWYGIELYNLEVEKAQKVHGFKIFLHTLPKTLYGCFDKTKLRKLMLIQNNVLSDNEPNDDIYKILKAYISTLSDSEIYTHSHLELDVGLDSLDYVELFTFIEQSFGVKIDETIFSKIMIFESLYKYIKQHHTHVDSFTVTFDDILDEAIDEKLIYSPYIMFAYKTFLLPLFKLYFRFEVIGKENIPLSPCIIAPSHQSMLDGFLIEASLPYSCLKKTFFLAYTKVFGRSLLEPIAKYGQSILIDANKDLKHSMQYSALPLQEGNNLVVFPEGARSRDKKLLEFRPFFAMLSKNFRVPVVPVVIDGSMEALETGKVFPKPKKIRVTYLKPISPEGLSNDELTAKVKEAIESEIKRNPVLS